ncbi:succinate dehydrogenase cytochrome b subunit [Pseudonocardia sp. ICBG601]|uniref:succinate dehydrogenase cytochrome b subunit n=1 Tax=Pseudonocardia sp. ICBG601 TaxID=2846759 RepID=UPI001CF6AE2B|nr:succinate dehydrogenase cytochrome b subunit [Pseudonocardia sp. ICBG601]
MSEKSRAGGGAKPAAPRRPRTPSALLKFVMAVSGVVLLGYVTLHMIGNLKIFFGPEAIDHYAAWLRTILEPALPYSGMLWIVRVVLVVAVVAHIWSATVLALRARKARPIKYAGGSYQVKGSYAHHAPGTMRGGGVIIVLFVVYHLLDLTAGTLNPNGVHLAVADNLAADFTPARWYVTLFYVLAVVALGFHVQHGIFWASRRSGGRRTGV